MTSLDGKVECQLLNDHEDGFWNKQYLTRMIPDEYNATKLGGK